MPEPTIAEFQAEAREFLEANAKRRDTRDESFKWGVGSDNVSIIGCDAANGTYYQLYSDERVVCRVMEMSIDDREWRLWREGEPFPQRFTGTFEDDGDTIVGRWEKAEDGTNYETDFDLIYRRVE